MKILTCNVRVSGAKDGDNSWPFRKDICAQQIASQSSGIICYQEMTATQFSDLSKSGRIVNAYNAMVMAEKMAKKPMSKKIKG